MSGISPLCCLRVSGVSINFSLKANGLSQYEQKFIDAGFDKQDSLNREQTSFDRRCNILCRHNSSSNTTAYACHSQADRFASEF